MPKKPNILIIMADHANADSLRPTNQCRTPALDSISMEGTKFENCHTTNAICSPARASLMTSLYPSTHGVWDVTHAHTPEWIDAPAGRFTHFADLLSDAGYNNGYFGKWHVEQSDDLSNFGWHEYNVSVNNLMLDRRKLGEEGYHEEVTLKNQITLQTDGYDDLLLSADISGESNISHPAFNEGISFIEKHLNDKGRDVPFTCFISVLEPHDPYLAPEEIIDTYDIDQISLSPSFHDTLDTKPEVLKRMHSVWSGLTDYEWKRIMASYYSSVTYIDSQIERVVNLLRNNDIYDDTLIIFTSDHGDMLSAHGLLTKGVATGYEEVYNIPLIIKPPHGGHIDQTKDIKVSTVDIAPTLLEYAGLQFNNEIHGKSLKSVLESNHNPQDWKRCHSEFFSQRYMYTQRITWEDNWKYIFNPGGVDELYDLNEDPFELNNLASDKDSRSVLIAMATTMWEEVDRIGDTTLLNSNYPTLRTAPIGPLSRLK